MASVGLRKRGTQQGQAGVLFKVIKIGIYLACHFTEIRPSTG